MVAVPCCQVLVLWMTLYCTMTVVISQSLCGCSTLNDVVLYHDVVGNQFSYGCSTKLSGINAFSDVVLLVSASDWVLPSW